MEDVRILRVRIRDLIAELRAGDGCADVRRESEAAIGVEIEGAIGRAADQLRQHRQTVRIIVEEHAAGGIEVDLRAADQIVPVVVPQRRLPDALRDDGDGGRLRVVARHANVAAGWVVGVRHVVAETRRTGETSHGRKFNAIRATQRNRADQLDTVHDVHAAACGNRRAIDRVDHRRTEQRAGVHAAVVIQHRQHDRDARGGDSVVSRRSDCRAGALHIHGHLQRTPRQPVPHAELEDIRRRLPDREIQHVGGVVENAVRRHAPRVVRIVDRHRHAGAGMRDADQRDFQRIAVGIGEPGQQVVVDLDTFIDVVSQVASGGGGICGNRHGELRDEEPASAHHAQPAGIEDVQHAVRSE